MTTSTSENASWLDRASVLAGSSLAGYRLPAEVDFVVADASGSTIRDLDGKEYIDYLLGSGPMILGHARREVVDAVTDQLGRGTTYYALNRPAIALAERIVDASPCAGRLRYSSTGAEATASAIRLARAYTGRTKIVKFEGAYHGSHDAGLMSFSVPEPTSFPEPIPDSAGIPESVTREVLIAPYNGLEVTTRIVERNADDIAAIIVEPLQRGIDTIPEFLQGVRSLADRIGAVLIFDEIVTGFRLAWGGALEYYGVEPDLVAYGKIIGGGFPLAAVAGKSEIVDLADVRIKGQPNYVHLSGTLNGNPVAATAGLVTLDILRQPGSFERLHTAGERLRAGLRQAGERRGIPLTIVGEGPLAGVHFVEPPVRDYQDVLRGDRRRLSQVNTEMVKRGVLVQLATKFYVSLAHSDEQIDRTVDAFDVALGTL